MADNDTVLNTMLEEKNRKLGKAQNPEYIKGALRVGTGLVTGFAAGVAAVVGGAVSFTVSLTKKIKNDHTDLVRRAERMMENVENSSQAGFEREFSRLAEEIETKLGKDFLQNEKGLAAHIMKHPTGWVAGLSALGAGIGAYRHISKRREKIDEVQHDISQLQTVRDSWQERHHHHHDKEATAEAAR
ncbi:MAG: hypothetical protein SFT92_03545 [Rickettsiales bacterium]|nr:hypothetical protein [Rickettsiales bacterium]